MAQPIAATPVLTGKEATKFITMIHEDAKKPVGLIPTPKLGKAQELIKQYSEHGKKHIR
jgi:Cft2 family RNA processing exonuclease